MFLSCPEHGTKKKFWVLLCCTAEQGLSLISYAKHDTNDIDDSNSIQEVCYIRVSWWALLTIEPLLLSDRASECGIWMSEVWFLLGLRSFILSHACDKTKKHLFLWVLLILKFLFPFFCVNSNVICTNNLCFFHYWSHCQQMENTIFVWKFEGGFDPVGLNITCPSPRLSL